MERGINMIWDKLASEYDKLWVQKYSLKPTRRELLKRLSSYELSEEIRILDIGCGTAQLLGEVQKNFGLKYLYGIDKSKNMLNLARNKYKKLRFRHIDIDICNLSHFKNMKFDIIICTHSFPYYKNKENVLDVVYNLLNENGIAIFAQASINNIYDKIAMTIIEATAEKADYLSRKDFEILASKSFFVEERFLIKERFFMPSIYGFVLRKKNENFTYTP